MAMSVASQSRDNLLEALRVQTEERKNEVKEIFLELRTALEQCEEGVDRELSELYSNTRERVERDGKKIQKLEKAKFNLQTDLVDNEFNSILQSTLDNFDAQIAEIRRCSVAIPTDVKLEWHKKELKSSILKVCKIVSSDNVRNSDGRNPAAAATQDLELEVQRLTRKNEEVEEFKKVEEEYKYTIAKLEARIAVKEREMSHRNEELRSTQDELDIPDPASGTTTPTTPTTRSTEQTKYKYTNIFFAKNKTLTYSLHQVENPKDHLGGIVLCRCKTPKHPFSEYVAGTLKTIIHPKFSYVKSIAGIEFLDPLGNCDGRFNGKRYFTSQPKHAAFISLDQIYIACEDAV